MNEWRPIPGYEGLYEASGSGQIRNTRTLRVLAGAPDTNGYPHVGLRGRWFSVHTLIALTFLGPRPSATEINHKNRVKADNRAANLEWITHKSNVDHARADGNSQWRPHWRNLHPDQHRGESSPLSKLTAADVFAIRAARTDPARKGDPRLKDLAARFGVTHQCIQFIVTGKTWRHLL